MQFKTSPNTKYLLLFFFLNFIISSFHIDTWRNDNTTSRVLPVVTFFETGTFQIDKYQHLTEDKSKIGGHFFSDKAPLPTLIILPFFGLLKILGAVTPVNGSYYGKHIYVLGTLLCCVIPFVIILLLTFKKILKNNNFSPVLLSTLPFYASFIFMFAGTLFNHMFSALFVLLGYIFLKEKKYFLSGIFSGMAFLSEYIIALVIAIWAIQILWNERRIVKPIWFGIGVIPSIVFILIYNYIFTGSPITMLYKFHTYQELHANYGFNHPTIQSLWGLLFSPYRGLFFYTPVLILVVFLILKYFTKFNIKEILKIFLSHYLFPSSIATILLVSSYFGWWGGWAYGPRLFLFIAVLLVYEGVIFLSKRDFSKLIFWGLISFGIICTFAAKITVVNAIPTDVTQPHLNLVFPELFALKVNTNNLLTYCFDTSPIIANLVWLLLFGIMIYILNNLWKLHLSKKQV